MRYCTIDGCNNKHDAHGYCATHCYRLKKYGDPNYVSKHHNGDIDSHPLYYIYCAMKQRILNKNNKNYNSYGGRGITICDRWIGKNGFYSFLEDVGDRPEGMTLDRIDVNGNYEPGNIRRASRREQASNQRKSNKDVGVSWVKLKNKWLAQIYYNGISKNLGRYDKYEDAVQARKEAEEKYLNPK